MKLSKLPRTAAAMLAVAVLTASCSVFHVASDVGVQQVNVDLNFGVKKAPKPQPQAEISIPPVSFPSFFGQDPCAIDPTAVDCVDPNPPPQPKPKPLCALHPSAIAPRDVAGPSITSLNVPAEGPYLFHYKGNYDGKPAFNIVGYKLIGDVTDESAIYGADAFSYSVEDQVLHYRLVFLVIPQTENSQNDGLYLKEADFPEKDLPFGGKPYTFIPASPMLLVAFELNSGDEQTSAGIDTSGKQANPAGLPPKPSANEMKSHTVAGSRETIDACDDLIQAYRVSWDLQITGEFDEHMLGTFWLATQYGGWPVRSDYVLSSQKLISGNFEERIMRVDPGDYL